MIFIKDLHAKKTTEICKTRFKDVNVPMFPANLTNRAVSEEPLCLPNFYDANLRI